MKKSLLFFVGLLLVLCLFAGGVSAYSGSGTANDPFILTSVSDLQLLSGTGITVDPFFVSAYYELGADINMSGVSFTPIGTSSIKFTGIFDGKNHTITGLNLHVVSNGYGLFSYVSGGTIKNIIIDKSYIVNDDSITHNYVGFLVGFANTDITIQNVYVKNSYIYSGTMGITYVSFVAGSGKPNIYNSVVENCVFNVDPSSIKGRVGGFVGDGGRNINNCTIRNCYINDDSGVSIGGIVGRYDGPYVKSITGCIVDKCTIIGGENVGGVAGISSPTYSTITNCTVLDCSISGNTNVAGVCN